MAERTKPYLRLNVKLLIMLLLAALAALALALLIILGGNHFVDTAYCSPARREGRIQAAITSFRAYVEEASVTSLDVEKIGV